MLILPWIIIVILYHYGIRRYNGEILVIWYLTIFMCYFPAILKYLIIVLIPTLIIYYSSAYFSIHDYKYFILFYLYCSWSAYHPRSFKVFFIILLPWFIAWKSKEYYDTFTYSTHQFNGIQQ